MRKIIFALSSLVLFHSVATADVISDNLAKAEKGVISAQKRLEKAQDCAADRETCLQDMTAKAQKAADRAAKKLEALMADAQPAAN